MRKAIPPVLFAAIVLASCAPAGGDLSRSEEVFGTPCSIRMVDGGDSAALDAAFATLHHLDDLLSPSRTDSELSAINRAAGRSAVKVSAVTYDAVSSALYFSRLTEGVTDLTAGPLINLWGIGTDHARVPSAPEIKAALALIDWRKVTLDPSVPSVKLEKAGMALDLGAFAKGWAADRVKEVLAARGVRAAIIDLGGNIFVFGSKKGGKPWKIGIQDPTKPRGDFMGIVTIDRADSVTTAGTYEQFFVKDGVKYHHILDLTTGRPARSGLESVSVIAPTSTEADGIDTALLIVGKDKGLELVARSPGVEAIFVGDDGKVWLSAGAHKSFRLTDEADWKLSE
ncbi:MAG: FAD:protein FMN transferase [Treponema sp.]|nr:FAD:protein FMN transferase [Treponema sp.]